MKTVFIGGSRHVSRLPDYVRERLDGIAEQGHRVVVGDANGADKAVQRHFADRHYDDVVVFCSGEQPRNNLGAWRVESIDPQGARGFQFYAAKDRAMARVADAGLMIWDGKSAGTLLNVLRLAQAGRKTVLATLPARDEVTIRSDDSWREWFQSLDPALRADLRARATAEEWAFVEPVADGQPTFDLTPVADPVGVMNDALRIGDADRFLAAVGAFATTRGEPWPADAAHDFATLLAHLSRLGIGLRAAAGRR